MRVSVALPLILIASAIGIWIALWFAVPTVLEKECRDVIFGAEVSPGFEAAVAGQVCGYDLEFEWTLPTSGEAL